MEQKQFEKIEQWFLTLNEEFRGMKSSMATKDLVENRFNMLAASMKALYDRLGKLETEMKEVRAGLQKLEERLGKRDEEVVVLRLALRKLEDDFEKLRNQVSSSQSLDRE